MHLDYPVHQRNNWRNTCPTYTHKHALPLSRRSFLPFVPVLQLCVGCLQDESCSQSSHTLVESQSYVPVFRRRWMMRQSGIPVRSSTSLAAGLSIGRKHTTDGIGLETRGGTLRVPLAQRLFLGVSPRWRRMERQTLPVQLLGLLTI